MLHYHLRLSRLITRLAIWTYHLHDELFKLCKFAQKISDLQCRTSTELRLI